MRHRQMQQSTRTFPPHPLARVLAVVALTLTALLANPSAHADDDDPPPADAQVTLAWPDDAVPEPPPAIVRRDGRQVFPRELYTLKRAEDYEIARHLGFNAVIEDGPDTFSLARRYDFSVTEASWFFTGATPQSIADAIRGGADSPDLLAYNLNDEPDLRTHIAPPALLVDIAAQIRALDPGAKTSVTLAGNSWSIPTWPDYAKAADIIRVDPYPLISRRPIRQVTDHVLAAREAAPGKPVICILQAWTWGMQPLPSSAQVHQMAAQALVAGANGLSWFDWNENTWDTRFSRAIQSVNQLTAQDLEPFLLHGSTLSHIESDQIAARFWIDANQEWRILLVDLRDPDSPETANATNSPEAGPKNAAPRTIALALPTSVPPSVTGTIIRFGQEPYRTTAKIREGRMELTLSPGQACILGPGILPELDRSAEYPADLAGRPMALHPDEPSFPFSDRTAAPTETPQFALSVHFTPFANALSLEGPSPYATRFRLFPGGRFDLPLYFSARNELFDLAIRPLSWTGNPLPSLTGPDLAKVVTLFQNPATTDPLNTSYTLTITLPPEAADWRRDRDHILAFQITYRTSPTSELLTAQRVLRFRIDSPFDADVDWITAPAEDFGSAPTARYMQATISPSFPLACYPDPNPATWQLRLPGTPLAILPISTLSHSSPATTDTDPPTTLTQRFRLTPLSSPGDTESQLIPLHAELQIGDNTFPIGLTSIQLANGHLYPSPPLEFIAPYIEGHGDPIESAPGPLSPTDFLALNHTISRAAAALPVSPDANTDTEPPLLPPFTQWSSPYSNGYTGVDHRISFAWDHHYLYLLADLAGSQDQVRAEVSDPSRGFRADDTLLLILQLDPDGPQTYLQFNPGGHYRSAIQATDNAQATPTHMQLQLQTATNLEQNRWQALLRIPWTELKPSTNTFPGTLQFTLLNSRKIAPREHFSLTPAEPDGTGPATGTLHLLPESVHGESPGTH